MTRAWSVMGTVFLVEVRGTSDAAPALAAYDSVRLVDSLLSTYRPESELSVLNASGRIEGASDVLLENLAVARRAASITRGAFDPTLGSGLERVMVSSATRTVWYRGEGVALDLGGSAKGDALDRAIRAVPGSFDVMVDLGGQTTVRSGGGPGWQIAVVDPTDPNRTMAMMELCNGSLATSGSYERGEHIVDPGTGAAPRELISVTVLHGNSAMADALATGFFVLGAEASLELADSLGIAVLLVKGGSGRLTPDRVLMSAAMAEEVGLREDLIPTGGFGPLPRAPAPAPVRSRSPSGVRTRNHPMQCRR